MSGRRGPSGPRRHPPETTQENAMTTPATAPAAPAAPRAELSASWRRLLIPAVLMLLGVAVMLYPIAAQFSNDRAQQRFAEQYRREATTAPPATLTAGLDSARRYNAALPATALADPWTNEGAGDTEAARAYAAELADFSAMARLRIPAIGVDLPVEHGTSEEVLGRAIGHLMGSSLPVGGPGMHAALTGHSAYAGATLFDRLPELREGDEFFVEVYGETLAYRVDAIATVLPDELDLLARDEGDHITLITCTPRAVNSHRLLVRGTRIPLETAVQDAPAGIAGGWEIQPWMYPRFVGAAAVLGLLGAMAARTAHQRRTERAQLAARTVTPTPESP